MKLRHLLLALPVVGAASSAFAITPNLSGNYLVTFHAAGAQDQKVCYTLVQNGAVLNFAVSGTFTAAGTNEAGYYFVTRHQLQVFGTSDGLFYDLTGTIDNALKTVVGTSFVIASGNSATPAVGGTFTALRNGC